jgi:hypothetical protein
MSEETEPKKSLREALVRLAVSPVKKEQEAISRLEKEAGRPVCQIIEELENAQLLIDSIGTSLEKSAPGKRFKRTVLTAIFTGTTTALIATFLQSEHIYTALVLGSGMGGSWSMLFSPGEWSERKKINSTKL